MTQKTDLNVTPYYDDYSESDSYHRVLFRPGFAVQARELTTLQSIMQNQIERFGRHIFKEGSIVIPGSVGYDNEYYSVKLQSTFPTASTTSISSYLSSYVGKEITGDTSGVIAKVINYVAATAAGDPDTLYVKYVSTGSTGEWGFTDGEDIKADAAVGSYSANVVSAACFATEATSAASAVTVTEGVFFIRGMFVRASEQTLILDKYTNTPSYRVGWDITEDLISHLDDDSLLDNAQGASNETAPGADRLKLTLTLAKHALTATTDINFVELIRLESGSLKTHIRYPQYSEIENMIARRTSEESGDYVVKPFNLTIKEHLDTGVNNGLYTSTTSPVGDETKFVTMISPGKGYVSGREVETLAPTVVDFDKARSSESVENGTISANLGQYVTVTNVYGSPDVTLNGTDTDPFKTIQLYSRQTSTRGSSSGTHVGNARVRSFEYLSGTAGATATNITSKYNLHLFDINMFVELTMSSANTLTANSLITGGTSGATGYLVATTSSSTTARLQGVTGRFTTGEAITSSTTADSEAGTISTVVNRNFNQDVKQVFMVYTVNSGEDFSGDIDLDKTFTMTGDFTYGTYDEVALEDGSGNIMQEDGSTNADLFGDNILAEGVGTGLQTLNGELSEELVVNDVLGLPTGANGAIQKRRVTAISGNVVTVDSAFSRYVTTVQATRFRGEIKEPNDSSLLFPMADRNVKTLVAVASDTTHTIRRQFSGTSVKTSSGGVIVFNTGGASEKFVAHAEKDYTMHIDTLGTSTTGIAQGDIVSAATGFVLSNSDQTLTITNTALGTNTAIKFIATINVTGATHKTKTRQKMTQLVVSNNASGSQIFGHRVEDRHISLGFADGYRAWAVYESAAIGTTPVSPQATVSNQTGVFADGEQIKGSASGATALVIDHTSTTVKFAYQEGTFTVLDQFVGQINSYTAQVTAVTTGDTNISSKFQFDSGQREGFYDIARISRYANESAPTGQLLIVYDYFTHGTGDFFSIDSYTNQLEYGQIPIFGNRRLSDVLDFRPRVANISTSGSTTAFTFNNRVFEGTGSSQTDIPRPDSSMTADYDYYLGRIDRLYLTHKGEFQVAKGTPANMPMVPTKKIPDAMLLATLNISPYTIDERFIKIKIPSNRRWRMQDITGISKRLKDLEKTVTLSLLEKDTENFKVLDAAGFDRFKTGFVVDNFKNHSVGDSLHEDYAGSVDRTRGEFRPEHDVMNVGLIEENTTDSERTADNYVVKGDLAMLTYTHEALNNHSNPFATRAENLNPFNTVFWNGTIDLSPDSDLWIDTEKQEAFNIAIEGDYNQWLQWNGGERHRREWKSWQTDDVSVYQDFFGGLKDEANREGGLGYYKAPTGPSEEQLKAPIDVSIGLHSDTDKKGNVTTSASFNLDFNLWTEVKLQQSRTGVDLDVHDFKQNRSAGDETTMEVVPWMRKRDITVTGKGFKPNTVLYPFFNKQSVAAHCRPHGTSSASSLLTGEVTKAATTITVASTTGFPDSGRLVISSIVDPTTEARSFDGGNLAAKGSGEFDSKADPYTWNNTSGTPYVATEEMVYSSKTATTFTISERGANSTIINEHKQYTDPNPASATYNTSIFPLVTDGVKGSELRTDSIGGVQMVFTIPSTNSFKFPVGKGVFRLTSSSTNSQLIGDTATSGEAIYQAFGQKQIKQERFNSLKQGMVTRSPEFTEKRTIEGNRTTHFGLGESAGSGKGRRPGGGVTSAAVKTGCYEDPLAQTIRIEDVEFPHGIFATKVDLYFQQKDTSTNPHSVRVELRSVINGYPSDEVIPGSQVTKEAADINVDATTAATVTTFEFDWPIHLKYKTEYAIVIITPSLDYKVWISRMGEGDVGGTSAVTEQPYLGSLFKSQNAFAWTASQFEDLKFQLHRAKFSTSTTGNVYLTNEELNRANGFIPKSNGSTSYMGKNPLEVVSGANEVMVKYFNHGMHSILNNVIIRDVHSEISDTTLNEGGTLSNSDTSITLTSATNFASAGYIKIDDEVIQYSGKSTNTLTGCTRGSDSTTAVTHEDGSTVEFYVFAGIPLTEINKTHTSISGIELDSFEITTTTNATATMSGGGSNALVTRNVTYDTLSPTINIMELPGTSVTSSAQVTTGMSLGSSQTPWIRTAAADAFEIPMYQDYIFTKPHVITSKINEDNELGGSKSFRINNAMTTTRDELSPMVDIGDGQSGVMCISNRINKIDSSSDVGTISVSKGLYQDSKQPAGDGNESIYMSREIRLQQEATAIKVLFDASIQSEAAIEVYYKIKQSNSEYKFSEIEWVPFNTTGIPDTTVPISRTINDFKEYEYTAGKNEDVLAITLPLENFSSFAIKIVMKSLNTSKPPLLQSFRALALAT